MGLKLIAFLVLLLSEVENTPKIKKKHIQSNKQQKNHPPTLIFFLPSVTIVAKYLLPQI